ncbi:MAG: hypothetical protein IH946_02945, partial [Bacteroidetes bacterium]|nr:hypothetical protein [Bacteroidota bacterium]
MVARENISVILKTYCICACMFLTVSLTVFGQEPPKTEKNVRINDIYFYLGTFTESNAITSLADAKKLAPRSLLLNNDMKDFTESSVYIMRKNSRPSAMLGMQFRDKQETTSKLNTLLRLGLSSFSGIIFTGDLFKDDVHAYDTLTSVQTGQTTYTDTLKIEGYTWYYSFEQLHVDGSLIFRTNPEARWSLFAGLGVIMGFSVNTNTEINYLNSVSVDTTYPNPNT